MTPKELLDMGITGILIAIILSGARGLWVYGRTYQERTQSLMSRIEELKQERDEWRRMALKGSDVAEKAVDAVAKKGGE